MSTIAQKRANRQNSKKSTGPKTVEGKSHSSKNALKHGLTSKRILIPGEDPKEYETLVKQLMAEYRPANLIQTHLVKEAANYIWRLNRIDRMEVKIFFAELLERSRNFAQVDMLVSLQEIKDLRKGVSDSDTLTLCVQMLQDWIGDENSAFNNIYSSNKETDDEGVFGRIVNEFLQANNEYENAKKELIEFARSPDMFYFLADSEYIKSVELLQRFRTQYERSLARTLNQLEHLQRVQIIKVA